MLQPRILGDLYHKYRPMQFKEIVGNKANIKSIKNALLQINQAKAYLLVGDSGCGKTTTARIMSLVLNCLKIEDGEPCLNCNNCVAIQTGACTDIIEVNAADTRGIDDARALRESMSFMPMQLKAKIYIIDEAQGLTPDAQQTLLKVLEEAPAHVFIILCTTDPQKIKSTVKNRCQTFKFKKLPKSNIVHLLDMVATYETYPIDKDTLEVIADAADGSPRNALVLLQQAAQLGFDDLDAVKKLISMDEGSDEGIMKLCFVMFGARPVSWSAISSIYNEVKHNGAEAIWMTVAGFARNKLLKGGKDTLFYAKALELFSTAFPPIKPENKLVFNLFTLVEHKRKFG